MNSNIFSWIEIYVDDMERAKRFYETVLGVRLSEAPMPEGSAMTMFTFPMADGAPGAAGALVKMAPREPGAAGTIVYFNSADCSEVNRVEAAGGQIIKPITPAGNMGTYCIFNDTEGNSVGLYAAKQR